MASDKIKLPHGGNRSVLGIQILFISIVIGTIGLAFVLIGVHSFLQQSKEPSVILLVEIARGLVNPEPTERFVFTILAVVVPLIAFVSVITSASSDTGGYLYKIIRGLRVARFAPLIVATLFFAPFFGLNFLSIYGADFLSTLLGNFKKVHYPVDTALIMFSCSVVSSFWCYRKVSEVKSKPVLSKITSNAVVWLILISSVFLQMLSWRLLGINSINSSQEWDVSADAVTYSLSQVVAGKTLLVDLPSQYGLWAEMVAPLFRITGFSVLGLTGFFAVLQLLSLGSLFFVLSKLVKISSLRVMAGLALVLVTFGTYTFFAGFHEPYFQYGPIRFFWPAVSVLVFYYFSLNKTIFRSSLMSLLGGVGILWNADSGLFIAVAYGAYLVAKLTILVLHRNKPVQLNNDPWIIKQYVHAMVAHLGITIFVIVSFLGVLVLKSGESLNFYWLFEYQKIFYNMGLMMMPLPRQIHPWMSILGVYLLGLLVAFHSWLHYPARNRMDTVFYLSMLGLGLFFYYQGRSHILNLGAVCWPAVLIAVILTDETVRAIRARILPKSEIFLPVVAVSLFLVCCFSFVSHGEFLFTSAEKLFSTREVSEAPYVVSELAFIKKYAAHKQECLILSRRQGIYYAESGLASPLKGPGIVETLLQADNDRLFDQFLYGGIQCVFLGISPYNRVFQLDEQMIRLIRDKYFIIDTNYENTMQYLELKP